MYRSIFVPLDGSPFGEQALPLALALARRAEAGLHIAHVHVPLAPVYAEGVVDVESTLGPALKRHNQVYLASVVQRLTGLAPVPVTPLLLEGAVAESLHNGAVAARADLIVMTTHGRGPLARSWLGSVADDLVRRTRIPLLLARPQETKADLAHVPRLEHVLIPLDGSPLAEQILEPAVTLGSLMRADYTLLRVIKPMVMGNDDTSFAAASECGGTLLEQLQGLHVQDRAEAQSYLDKVAERLRALALRVQTRVVVNDQPAVAILEEVRAHRADVVALATHGRSGLPRLFLGSVADKVLRGASVPVLVHRPVVATVKA